MDDEVEYESDSELKKPKTITSSEINTHEIGNEYIFFKYDYFNNIISNENINMVLVGVKENIYKFINPYKTEIEMLYGIDRFIDSDIFYNKTIIWVDNSINYYICHQIKFDYINHENYCHFFIEDLYYDFSVTRKEGITNSVKNARLLFDNKTLHNDSVVYIFMLEEKNKFYHFIINEKDELEFYGKKLDPKIQIEIQIKNGICDSSKIQDICIDDLDDDDDDEEMDSNEIAICANCGESYFKEADQVMCFYCRNTIAEMNKKKIFHNPMDYPGYYDIKTVRNIDLNRRDEIPPPIIITMFFGLHGHGQIVNSNNKKDIKFTTRGSEYAKPFTSGYEVEISTFKSKPSCRTHMVCMGNPLLVSFSHFTHNGITFNKKIDELFSKKHANVNSVLHGIIKDETDYHNFSTDFLKDYYFKPDFLTTYGEKLASLGYKNYLALIDRTWGISTNFGSIETAIAEKYVFGYSSKKEKMDRIQANSIMDPAVDVNPIVRALYCNISYKPDNTNSSKKIDEVIFLKNSSSLSSISSICEDYLINFYKNNIKLQNPNQKVELVSIIIDKTCNHSTDAIVFPHTPVSTKIIDMNFHGKYNAEGKGKTHKRKQSKQRRKQRKSKQKRKQSKIAQKR